MTDLVSKKPEQKKAQVNALTAVVTGAVIGAGVAIAGVVALADEKNRKRVKNTLSMLKDKALNFVDEATQEANVAKDMAEEKVLEGKSKTKKVISDVKKTIKKEANVINKKAKQI